MYVCNCCNYTTNIKCNFNKHIASNKHRNKLANVSQDLATKPKQKYICKYCDMEFKFASSLSKHKKDRCQKKNKLEQENQIIKTLEKTNQELLKMNKELIDYIKSNKTINTNNGTINNIKNISIINYIKLNYNNAPNISSLNDYTFLKNNEENEEFIDTINAEHRNNNLHRYLGDFIIKYYKKENPINQSFWNSDSSRLTYLIKELLHNKSSDWIVDKKGVKVKTYVINPMTNYIKDNLTNYINKCLLNQTNNTNNNEDSEYSDSEYNDDSESSEVLSNQTLKRLQYSYQVIQDIGNDIVQNNVIRYITPYFYLNTKAKDISD